MNKKRIRILYRDHWKTFATKKRPLIWTIYEDNDIEDKIVNYFLITKYL